MQNFWILDAYKSYVYTILLSIKCAIVLHLKNNGYTLVKNTLLLKLLTVT